MRRCISGAGLDVHKVEVVACLRLISKRKEPASPAAARRPRAATQLPRRRAWLRILFVRCSLPCDPPVGGHSCNGEMIPRFHRAVCD
jgi:hypothetical protein